ncbi:hypothetical protein [Nocardia noduli]|uniref:hypothetical protein n=1 Tax=Nocardia noduli TaxID=2815722 RepID=UPI001C24F72B|nr:hypothetical protein [Nocardia noduli]
MYESFATLMPNIEVAGVVYRPHAIADDPASPPMVRVAFDAFGSGLSFTITDARALFAGLGDALATHDRGAVAAVKAVA